VSISEAECSHERYIPPPPPPPKYTGVAPYTALRQAHASAPDDTFDAGAWDIALRGQPPEMARDVIRGLHARIISHENDDNNYQKAAEASKKEADDYREKWTTIQNRIHKINQSEKYYDDLFKSGQKAESRVDDLRKSWKTTAIIISLIGTAALIALGVYMHRNAKLQKELAQTWQTIAAQQQND
jgi:hypothetical protein